VGLNADAWSTSLESRQTQNVLNDAPQPQISMILSLLTVVLMTQHLALLYTVMNDCQ